LKKHWRVLCLSIGTLLAAAACGNGGSSSGGPPPHGNVLYEAAAGEPDSLDPGGGISGFDTIYYEPFTYDTLTRSDPRTSNPTPGLATSWSWMGADKTTLRMVLRQGVKFQDGTPMDAAAVVASLDHYRTGIYGDLAPVTGETVVDDRTIDIHLRAAYSPLPAILSYRAGMVVSPTALKKYGKDFGRHPVGAGPYMLTTWTPGAELDLTRFGDYWEKGTWTFKGVDFKVIADPNATINALKAGQVDFAGLVGTSVLSSVRNSSNLVTRVIDVSGEAIITTNNKVPPFNDVRVRKAANMAVNRQKLSDAINGKGVGLGPAWQYEPPNYWPYSKEIKDFGYHPAQAKELLREAGYPNGITVQLCHFQTDLTDAQIEKADMAAAGINVVIDQEPVNSCVAKMANATIPMVQIGWGDLATPYQTFATMFGSPQMGGAGGFGPYPGVDDLLQQLASSYTQQDQKPIFDKLNRTLYDLAPSIPLYYFVAAFGYTKRLQGFTPTRGGALLLRHAYFK
jgi:peptide/nickel transport system substrate-binding protein